MVGERPDQEIARLVDGEGRLEARHPLT
jgi:hypothetical protein